MSSRPLALCLALAVLPCSAAAQIFVSPTGDDTTGTGAPGSPFKTISHAASIAAAGQTLVLTAGTFGDDEEIVLGDKNLTIVGAGRGVTIIVPHPTATATYPTGPLPGTPTEHRVVIAIDGGARIDLRELTIDGAFRVPATQRLVGLLFRNGADGTVENVEIKNARAEPLSASPEPVGVVVRGDHATDVTDVRLRSCWVHNFGQSGVAAAFNAKVDIEYCTVQGAGPVGVGAPAQSCILIADNASGIVRHNAVTDARYGPTTLAATGILLQNAGTDVRVEANNVARCEDNIALVQQPPRAADAFVRRNKSTAAFSHSLRIDGHTRVIVGNNVFHGVDSSFSPVFDSATTGNTWTTNNYSDWTTGSYAIPGGTMIDFFPRRNCDEFQRTDEVLLNLNPRDFAVGQLNGSGQLDLAVVNEGSPSVSIVIEEAGGHFITDIPFATANAIAIAVAVGQFDGRPGVDVVAITDDVAPATGENKLYFFVNDGRGRFTAGHVQTMPAGALTPVEVTAGDVDGNGLDDVAVAHLGTATVPGGATIYRNLGGGTSWQATMLPGTAQQSRGITLARVDAGTSLDVILTEGTGTTGLLHLYANDGAGTFTEMAVSPLTVGANPRGTSALDMDADGDNEVFVTSWNGPTPAQRGSVAIFWNELPTRMRLQTVPTEFGPNTIATGDVGNDPDPDTVRPDAVVLNWSSRNFTLLGEFGLSGPSQGIQCRVAPTAPLELALRDMDSDGYNDLVVAHTNNPRVIFRENEFPAREDVYGSGCPGFEGRVPLIATDGDPPVAVQPNPLFKVRLTNARATSPAALMLGFLIPSLAPCTLTVNPVILVPVATSADGNAALPLRIPPSTSFYGGVFYTQWIVVDAGSAFLGLSLTEGLKVRIGL